MRERSATHQAKDKGFDLVQMVEEKDQEAVNGRAGEQEQPIMPALFHSLARLADFLLVLAGILCSHVLGLLFQAVFK